MQYFMFVHRIIVCIVQAVGVDSIVLKSVNLCILNYDEQKIKNKCKMIICQASFNASVVAEKR